MNRILKFRHIKRIQFILILLALGFTTLAQDALKKYSVIWDSPSEDFNGSMPIGNGDIGANVKMYFSNLSLIRAGKQENSHKINTPA